MKILKPITLLIFLMSTMLSCAQWGNGKKVKGNGDVTTSTRTTSSYNAINAAGPMDFILIEGKEGEITIKADANLMDYIATEVTSNQLTVKVKDGFNLKPSKTIIVTIPYDTIDKVSLAGSGDLKNNGTINSDNFKVSLAGSGDIKLKVSAEDIESSIAGSGDIELSGTTSNLSTEVTGSGDFNGKNLKSINVKADITGSGSINVYCDGKLKARITGSGDVRYSGKPTSKDTAVTGSGSISN